VEPTVIIGLILFIASEILPFTPLKGNGLADAIIKALRVAFPHKSDTEK
tara:strand:+ start:573 stop:719 length:147 start_codon:yes stop_codon:yes gene_type:complete